MDKELVLEMTYFSESVKGLNRKQNQDNTLVIDTSLCKMFFLFDGVGGAENGKLATELAIDFIEDNYFNYFEGKNYNSQKLLFDTNYSILHSGVNDALTTVSCLILLPDNGNKVIISNIGDTRVYSFTYQTLEKISVDDRLFSHSNIITKCLGLATLKFSDIHQTELRNEDNKYLLCTDGFYTLLEREKLNFLNVLNDDKKLLKRRINKLIQGKNSDDSTYIVVYS